MSCTCECCCNIIFVLLAVFVGLKICLKWQIGMCTSTKRMDGKTVIITGANTGIGKETAMDLAQRRARVILACRNVEKGNQAKDEIIRITGNQNVVVRKLDLASLTSVKQFAKEIIASEPRIDVLINNAGSAQMEKQTTEDGLLFGMQVNHFGPFLLTNLLLDVMKKSSPSRIIFVASTMHQYASFNVDDLNFNQSNRLLGIQEYSWSKLANVLTANEMAKRLAKTGVTVNSLHPGTIYSDIWRNFPFGLRQVIHFILSSLFKTVKEGSQTTIHLAVSDDVIGVTGKYFQACKEKTPSALAKDEALAKKLWVKSEGFVKLKSK